MAVPARHGVSALLAGLALLGGLALAAGAPGQAASPKTARTVATVETVPSAQETYDRFAREYLDWYYAAHPLRATRLGIHRYDDRMPDWSREGVDRRASELRDWLSRLQAIDREALEGDAYWDYRILDYALRGQLLELEEVRGWERDPRHYAGVVSSALSSLATREFAPVGERARHLIARARQIPDLMQAGRANLRDVPELWTELAVRDARGTVSYLQEDLPAALHEQGLEGEPSALREELEAALETAAAEMEAYAEWLEVDVLPGADGDFRLGADLFQRKLRYEEHVELTAEELHDLNEGKIREYQEWVAREAARIDPERPPAEVMDSITSLHPSPEELIPTARRYLQEIREFIVRNEIVPLPSDRMPEIRPTPEYARMGFASMSTPGPFEDVATEAYYYITNVDPEWSEEQQRQHLTYFNYPGLLGITVHEAMPGHFVQLLYEQQIPTEVRKVFTPASLVEGWAHYCEQMMVDEGLGGGDPAVRLGQLRRALQRHARWHAGLSMHAFGATVEEAAERFQEIAYFAPFPALREVQRGTYNPTYLYYALGRMQIFDLREDYRRHLEARGREFSLREFHERFLRLGLPVALARQAMIPGEGPAASR